MGHFILVRISTNKELHCSTTCTIILKCGALHSDWLCELRTRLACLAIELIDGLVEVSRCYLALFTITLDTIDNWDTELRLSLIHI